MTRHTSRFRLAGLPLGAAAAIGIAAAPLEGLSREGQLCLAFTLMAVIFWGFKVMDASFVAGLFLVSLVVFRVGTLEDIFSAWTGTVVWLVIGSFLLAHAIVDSGLGNRLTYWLILNYVRSFRSIILIIFILSIILALIIPNPWPRAFILSGVMKEVAASAHLSKRDHAALGLAVFSFSIPTCFIFLTGAGSMNQLVLSFVGAELSWVEWLIMMGVPGLAMTALYAAVIWIFFQPMESFFIDMAQIRRRWEAIGPLTKKEKQILIWFAAAVVLWMTDSLHGINIAWTTMAIAMLMALPFGGSHITPRHWKEIPLGTLVYLTAASAIGRVGTVSGMTAWMTERFLPQKLPQNIVLMSLLVAGLCMLFHLCLGSTITANSVLIPAMLLCVQGTIMPPIVCAMLCYTAIFGQFIFSYQHINILLGIGNNGMYTERDSLRMATPLTAGILLVILLVELPWWRLLGIL